MSYSFPSWAGVPQTVAGHDDLTDDVVHGGWAHIFNSENPAEKLLELRWQDGPVDREAGQLPNGVFVEDVIEICVNRLLAYQASKFNCVENESALAHLKCALDDLTSRRKDRRERGVEGQNKA